MSTSPTSPAGSGCASPIQTTVGISSDTCCQLCNEAYKQPRVLSCLHIFCTECLEKQVESLTLSSEEKSESETEEVPASIVATVTEGLDSSANGVIVCSVCKQETVLPEKGVEDLQLDHVMVSMLETTAMDDMQIVCTSCKAKEKAVAQCNDCVSFLCPNCVTAHQYMRCFENHKVVSFEDAKNTDGITLHKPMFCTKHSSEVLKFYCSTCQETICSECMMTDHKPPEHNCERVGDIEAKYREELTTLSTESRAKAEVCSDALQTLETALSDLQSQRDDARSLIQETFQSYKAIIEKRQEELLAELESIHSTQELNIMDMFHQVEKTSEKIDDACDFCERVLKNGSDVQLLALHKGVNIQLLSLINNTPRADVNVKIEFNTDRDKFENAVKKSFGSFQKEEEPKLLQPETPTTSLQNSFEVEGFALPSGVLSPDDTVLPPVSASDFMPNIGLSPLSMPNLMPMPVTGTAIVGVSSHAMNTIASSMSNMPGERSSSRNSYSPSMSDSGISVDTASGSSSAGGAPVINAQALSKLGQVGVNSQGQVTLNGQAITGLNVNNVSGLQAITGIQMPGPQVGMPPTSTSRVQTPTTPGDATLASLLSSVGGLNTSTSGTGTRSGNQTPTALNQLSDLAGLLNQTSSTQLNLNVNGLAGLTNSGATTPTLPGLPLTGGAGLNMPPPPSTPTTPFANPSPHPPFPTNRGGKCASMQIRCKFGQLGPAKCQFNSPHGFCLGLEEDIVVADTNNHRIQIFEKTGEFKYQFGIPGSREEGQLWYPRKVAVMRHSGKYVVCDRGNERSRMQIFTKNGHFIKKIAIRYIDIVAGLAITQQGHIVAVDSVSPTVFVIAETGDLIKWFDCSDYMREPSDIAISGKEYFVCDFKGHCVVVFNEDGQFIRRIGCENITNFPNGIDISDAGDVLVGDSHGNRFHVAVFTRDGSLIGEFECPYVKVSRCCGLKITSEGYVVTLAKNNHHVLVLNTLYIA